ncbi:MAG: hypothetical protein Kow0069_30760 [Promethearchaeota archaeon]
MVVVVLDARDPVGTRPARVERFTRRFGRAKSLLLVLNKADLVPKAAVDGWVRHIAAEGVPVVPFSGKKRWGFRRLLGWIQRTAPRVPSGAKVLLVGYPNTGKSTIVNVLVRGQKRVGVSSRAGHTRGVQLVRLPGVRKLYLVDSPGIVPLERGLDDVELALRSGMAPEKVGDPLAVVEEVVRRAKDGVVEAYGVEFEGVDALLEAVGRKLGRLRRGGQVDRHDVCLQVIRDWQAGKIAHHLEPPPEAPEGTRDLA